MTSIYFNQRHLSHSNNADSIFQLYDHQRQESLTVQQFKELVDHLFFLVLYALPAMIDKLERPTQYDIHKSIQYLKQEMLKNAQADKHNLVRIFTNGQFNSKYITREHFVRIFSNEKSLHNALGLRSRVMPVIGSTTSAIYIKQEMLRRCYAPKNQGGDRKKKVRFMIRQHQSGMHLPTTSQNQDDDHISVRSSRSEKISSKKVINRAIPSPAVTPRSRSRQSDTSLDYSEKKERRGIIYEGHGLRPQGSFTNLIGAVDGTHGNENNMTREDSTTISDDRFRKLKLLKHHIAELDESDVIQGYRENQNSLLMTISNENEEESMELTNRKQPRKQIYKECEIDRVPDKKRSKTLDQGKKGVVSGRGGFAGFNIRKKQGV